MSTTTTTQLEFKANTSAAQSDIKKLGEEIKDAGDNASEASTQSKDFGSGLETIALGAVAAVAAVKQIAGAASECVEAFKTQEQAEAKLNATLEATGLAGEMSMSWLKDLASGIQSYTTFGDEAVLEAERILVATKALNSEGLERTITLSADLAAAMGTDISTAAQTLAKALQEPGEGLTRLRTIGISFTEDEEALIQSLMDSNDVLGAQNVILDAVEARYAGIAAAIGETDTGKLTQIANVWGDIKENLGAAILQSVSPALDALLNTLNQVSAWMAEQQGFVNATNAAVAGDSSGFAAYSNDDLATQYKNLIHSSAYGHSAGQAQAAALATEIELRGGTIGSNGNVKFADGGIVLSEINNATIGEAGPEAIIPLDSAQGRALTGGGVNINITIQGNADAEKVYEAIEKAQRTGKLPSWRYA